MYYELLDLKVTTTIPITVHESFVNWLTYECKSVKNIFELLVTRSVEIQSIRASCTLTWANCAGWKPCFTP